jgi:ABC-type glycerol-3-phosphate transport system substrate-binding protein
MSNGSHDGISGAREWSRRRLLQGAAGLAGLAAVGSAVPAYAGAQTAGSGGEVNAAGVTLKALVNTPHQRVYQTILAPAWKQMTGGTLEVTAAAYNEVTNAQIRDVQSGAGAYDLFDYLYFGLGSLAEAGALVDLTDWIASQDDLDTKDYLPSIYDPYTLYNKRRYGLPYDGDQQLVYYNTELFNKYNLQPPTTWDEYDAAAKKITQGGSGAYYGAVVQGQPDPIVLGCAFINRLVGYGGSLVDDSGRPDLTSDAAIAAVEHLVNINPYALPTPLQVGLDTANTAWFSGKVALIENWTGLALRSADPTLSQVAGKWGVVALPLGGDNKVRRTPLDTGYGIGVSTASKNKSVALSYIKWVTSVDAMLMQTTAPNSAIDPNRVSVLNSSAYAAATPTAVDLIRAGLQGKKPMAWPNDAYAPQNLQTLVDQIATVIRGETDAKTALKKAQDSWQSKKH